MLNVVSAALLAKSAEVTEVFSNLGRGHVQADPELLGAHDFDIIGLKPAEHPYVQRQALNYNVRDFFGRRDLRRPALVVSDRSQLVRSSALCGKMKERPVCGLYHKQKSSGKSRRKNARQPHLTFTVPTCEKLAGVVPINPTRAKNQAAPLTARRRTCPSPKSPRHS